MNNSVEIEINSNICDIIIGNLSVDFEISSSLIDIEIV